MDMSITLGNVLTIVTTVAGLFMAWGKIKERLVAIEVQIRPLWREYENRRRYGRGDDGDSQ